MTYIDYTTNNRIAFITLNRPEKRNALSYALISELKEAFEQAEKDPSVKVIVLKANGKVFCAGADLADLKKLQNASYQENLDDSNHLEELFYQLYTLKKVVIAQVQGHALAGGCGLATVCDFSFAASEAKFGYSEVRIGFIPAFVMIFLLRKIGEGKTKQLLLTGDSITAQEAQHLGLINRVTSKEKLDDEVLAFAEKLVTSNSLHSMMVTKQMISEVQSMNLSEALTFASKMNAEVRISDDCKRGITLFLEKKKISW